MTTGRDLAEQGVDYLQAKLESARLENTAAAVVEASTPAAADATAATSVAAAALPEVPVGEPAKPAEAADSTSV